MIDTQIKAEFKRRMQEESLLRITSCLNMMTEEHIWFSPNDHVNSVGNLVLHLCGNIRQYIISTFYEQSDVRERDLEFSSHQSHNRDQLKQKINETIIEAVEIVQAYDSEQLTEEFGVQGFKETGWSIIVHVIEHTSYHTGQITTMCKWLEDLDTQYYAGHDLNKKG